ncbi:DUF2017 domain-containing protein [Microlunatus antarcticus]|uniref:DUF2017 domain-containing protein n=1 Tax=Microlunatus antarcticus TaxID=53388 RepID=A0A7W5JT62_9ACTN|nr:DUF2017 domain-containing protein [Microlunatus antarcticus]MBB3325872.1 hypothetical protein [Microlunatus antarcticus]
MKKFVRRRGVLTTGLSPYEVELLTSLVRQVVELVSDGEPEGFATPDPSADPFEALTAGLQVDPDEPEVSDDPVLRRMFPNAYPHDADASSDFRRFTERGLRTTKVTDAGVVLEDLDATRAGSTDLRVAPEHVEAWLRTLTTVRIAVATRLGVTDAESAEQLADLDESDPRSYMVSVYDWLGFAQETMVGAL